MHRILGIDPGSQVTGFGILETDGSEIRLISHGIIELKRQSENFNDRLFMLSENLEILLKKYQPKVSIIEKIFLGKNPDSAFKLGHARGVCVLKCMEHKTQIFEYATREVKKSITGNGGAEKLQVCEVLKILLNIQKIDYLDASDALALAFHYCTRIHVENRLKEL